MSTTTPPSIDPDEVAASVAKLVPGDLSTPLGALSTRNLSVSWDGFQQAVVGMFISSSQAPYYVVKLARDRLLTDISHLILEVQALSAACSTTTRQVQPVTNIAPLSNAQVALQALSKAAAQRTGVYQNIASIPAFNRLTQNVTTFLKTEGVKATQSGQLVNTPSQAKGTLSASAVQLRTDWDALLTKLTLWSGSMTTYAGLNLPGLLSQTILGNAADVMAQNVQQLQSLSPNDRLGVLRSVVVDTVAIQATVQGFGALTPPTVFVPFTGVGKPLADALHPAAPATLTADYPGGYAVYLGKDTLSLLLDGQYTQTIHPPGSFVAQQVTPTAGPFTVLSGVTRFNVTVEQNSGPTTLSTSELVTLPVGSNLPLWTIADAINRGVTLTEAGVYFIVQQTAQEVTVTPTSDPVSSTFTLENGLTWSGLNVDTTFWLILADTPAVGLSQVWQITGVTGAVAICTLIHGVVTPFPAPVVATVGTQANLRLYIRLKNPATALHYEQALRLTDVDSGALAQLSFFSGAVATSARTSAATLALLINQSTAAASLDGTPRVTASTVFVPNFFTGLGRTSPTDPFSVTYYRGRSDGVSFVPNSPTTTAFTVPTLAASGILPGDVLVLRATNNVNDTNTWGTVVSITADGVITTTLTPLGTGPALIEVGPSFYPFSDQRADVELAIAEQQTFDGQYLNAITPGATPLDVRVTKALLGNVGPGGQPVFLQNLQMGQRYVVLNSQDSTTAGAVQITGQGNFDAFLVNSTPRSAVAMASWVTVPSLPNSLQLGDQFELYTTKALTPSFTALITSVDTAASALELSTPLPANQPPFMMDVTSTLPFARVRNTVNQSFVQASQVVEGWLTLPMNNTTQAFQSLDAALNPLIANSNPTQAQATVALTIFQNMLTALSSLIATLQGYTANVVEGVDSLIKGYQQKGLDKAVDILLMADFATFFGLDQDDSSYAGSLAKAMRTVQVTDFPVRRDNRVNSTDTASEQTLSQFDDVDFDYTPDVTDPNKRIDTSEGNSPNINLPNT
jgi:hypothetical protein